MLSASEALEKEGKSGDGSSELKRKGKKQGRGCELENGMINF